MGNIHIFIPDGLHERLRRVCRHKVTQQKFLEEGIEKLVSEKEGHSVLCTDKKLADVDPIEMRYALGVSTGIDPAFLEGFNKAEEKEEEVAAEGVAIPPQYYVPEGEGE